jgi:hypothetical protein
MSVGLQGCSTDRRQVLNLLDVMVRKTLESDAGFNNQVFVRLTFI